MSHKKQHWIPQSYLSAWCDPNTPKGQEPYVWRFSKDGGAVQKKAPKNIFWETDMYTIRQPDAQRDLVLEHGLSELESSFVRIRREKLASRLELEPEERLLVQFFVAAMEARTASQRDHQRDQWGNVLRVADDLAEKMAQASPEERERFAAIQPISSDIADSLSHEQVRELAKNPLQQAMFPRILGQIRHFAQMHMAIIETGTQPGFITSDAPCVWFDPEAYKRPPFYQTLGLVYRTIEITLPISPEQVIVISWHKELEGYKQAENELVVEGINRRTRFHCKEYFIVNQSMTREIWFDRGKPPENFSP